MEIQWRSEKRKIKDLKDYSKNPRKIDKDAFQKLVDSIKSDGYHQRLIINVDGTIIGGHSRKKALLKAGLSEKDEIEVLIPDRLLTAEEFDRINIRDNLPYGSFDFDMLANLFEPEKLIEWGMPEDWLQTNVEEIEINDEDESVPEIQEEAITKLGDVWKLGEHRLMCGDSAVLTNIDKLMGNLKANMVFTDPPYGYNYKSNHYKKGNPFGTLENDDKIIDFLPLLKNIIEENCSIYICGSHQTIHIWRDLVEKEFIYKNTIVWKKNNWSMGDLTGAYACQHELILFAHNGKPKLKGERHRDVWEFNRDPPKNHPTQKPIELICFAITNSSDKNNLILDLFGGSGSTLIACEKSKRKCFMMELSPNYCDVIIARWEKLTNLKAELLS